ncbi:MAG TPA: hypothetical protein VFT55_08590 [Planctomycetota bacterium]|nr:hypothetical protein [Planctomycetota bacterium]
MALELAILDDQDRAVRTVELGVDEHWVIVHRAQEHAMHLLGRLRNYYRDARFEVHELPALMTEVQTLAEMFPPASAARLVLAELEGICVQAIDTRRPLVTLTD